jgi:predicted Zn-dependent peptidase
MGYNTHTLPCGLRIIHLPSDSPVTVCGYGINAGSRDELPGEEGLAHFCEHVTFKGTQRRRAWHVLNCLERVGGELNAFTGKEDTVYYAMLLREHLPRAIDLLTDIVFHSEYPQREIDKEVAVICDEIESYNDSPAELIYDDFENLVFKDHPLGHHILGQAEHLRTYTTVDALRFTHRYYRPENAVFFVSGGEDFSRIVRLLEKATADFPAAAPLIPDLEATPLRPNGQAPQSQEIHRSTHQAHVLVGCRAFDVHHPLRMPLYLLNNLLGGPGMNTRLNLSLRERRGLVYTVESSMVSYSDTGLWSVYFGCDSHDVNRCLRLVRGELDRLMRLPLTPRQLGDAKRQLKGQIGLACDNRESFALSFGKSFLHYGWERDIDALYRKIDGITAEDLHQVATQLFAPERLTTLIYR